MNTNLTPRKREPTHPFEDRSPKATRRYLKALFYMDSWAKYRGKP